MNETYDPGNHLLLIALIVFYWHLLRIWHQPPPPDRNDKPGEKKAPAGGGGEPDGVALRQVAAPQANDKPETRQRMATASPAMALEGIRAADQRFDEATFLTGASQAFELIVNAYANEDAAILEQFLDAETADGFNRAIAARRERGERLSLTFIGIKELEITDVGMAESVAEITIRFVSEMVAVTHAADGTIVDGDPGQVVEVTDLWTFTRPVSSSNPAWKLVATEGG